MNCKSAVQFLPLLHHPHFTSSEIALRRVKLLKRKDLLLFTDHMRQMVGEAVTAL